MLLTLIGLLRGETDLGDHIKSSSAFGQLRFRSEAALGKLIDTLLAEGLVAEKTLSHGGVALGITPCGQERLREFNNRFK